MQTIISADRTRRSRAARRYRQDAGNSPLVGRRRSAHECRNARELLHGRIGRYETAIRGEGPGYGSTGLHEKRAHRDRRRRIDSALARQPFAAPVIVTHVRPDSLDHVRLRRRGMHDRSRAAALAPANPLVFGLQVVSIIVLARDTLFQGDLRGVGRRRTVSAVLPKRNRASRSFLSAARAVPRADEPTSRALQPGDCVSRSAAHGRCGVARRRRICATFPRDPSAVVGGSAGSMKKRPPTASLFAV